MSRSRPFPDAPPLYGIRLVSTESMVVPGVVATKPHPWIEYSGDESWAWYFGFVSYGLVPDPNLRIIAGSAFGHPATIDAMLKKLKGGPLRMRAADLEAIREVRL